jgi:hypothetical protein
VETARDGVGHGFLVHGRFWVTNHFYPRGSEGGMLWPAAPAGIPSPDRDEPVERLVEYRSAPEGLRRTGRTLELRVPGSTPHNREGVARLPGGGFLVVTDEFPGTVLTFVPFRDRRR